LRGRAVSDFVERTSVPGDGFTLESPLFHVTQVVDSVDRARDVFERLFRRPIREGDYKQGRWALFTRVGDALVEAMIPDMPAAGMRRFVDRFGSHWHSLGWYVDGIDALAETLLAHDVNLVDGQWKPLDRPPVPRRTVEGSERDDGLPEGWWSAVFWTQLRAGHDIHGLHEFCQPMTKHQLARWAGAEPLADDPLTVRGTSHLTTVVADRTTAANMWSEVLGGRMAGEKDNELLGARSAFVVMGGDPGVTLEFAEPNTSGPAQVELDACGVSILYSTTFLVDDLAKVRAHLSAQDFPIELEQRAQLVTDPTATAVRYGFADSPLQLL